MAILRKGSKGHNVRLLQIYLNHFGESLAIDGDFGQLTQSAVVRNWGSAVVTESRYWAMVADIGKKRIPLGGLTGKDFAYLLAEIDQQNSLSLLYTNELIDRLNKAGKQVDTASHRQSVLRYEARQQALKNSTVVSTENYVNNAWNWLQSKWSGNINGIGAIPAIPVAVVVIGVIGVIAYNLFYDPAHEAVYDWNKNETRRKAYERLGEDLAKELQNDIQSFGQSEYNQGKANSLFEGFSFTNPFVLAAIGFVGYKLIFR